MAVRWNENGKDARDEKKKTWKMEEKGLHHYQQHGAYSDIREMDVKLDCIAGNQTHFYNKTKKNDWNGAV